MYLTTLDSPIGRLTLASDGSSLTGLWIDGQKYAPASLPEKICSSLPVFQQTSNWLCAYFSHSPLPPLPALSPQGTPFRQEVWKLLQDIPYGHTTTYGTLARKLREQGISASAQAVGGAVGHNPISILIPCHRVLGHNGTLTGYAGGFETKRYLLNLENIM